MTLLDVSPPVEPEAPPTTELLSTETRHHLQVRLRRIEGQARGITRMIDEGRDCLDVLTQVLALRAAADAVAGELMEETALHCLRHPADLPAAECAARVAKVLAHRGR